MYDFWNTVHWVVYAIENVIVGSIDKNIGIKPILEVIGGADLYDFAKGHQYLPCTNEYGNKIYPYIKDDLNKTVFFHGTLNSDRYKIFKIPNLDINDRYILNKKDINKNNIDRIINFSKKYNLNDIIVVKVKTSETPVKYNINII